MRLNLKCPRAVGRAPSTGSNLSFMTSVRLEKKTCMIVGFFIEEVEGELNGGL